jgi:Cytochrome P450
VKNKPCRRAILHDDALFPDPFTFKPERFIDPNMDPRVPAAVDYAFGFGRRVCPGRWMAHSFVWIVVASVLSTFQIEKAVRNGRVIEPTGAFSPGILACVIFSCLKICSRLAEQMMSPYLFFQPTGLRKNSSVLLNHGRRRLKRLSAQLRRHDLPLEGRSGYVEGPLCFHLVEFITNNSKFYFHHSFVCL